MLKSLLKNLDKSKLLPILIPPHPILHKRAEEVLPKDMEEIKKIIPAMFKTMYDAPGIGLAAPQIGISKRFYIMDLSRDEEAPDPKVLINPEIIEKSEKLSSREEGCLSLPQQFAEIIRPEKVKIRYQDLNGNIIEEEGEDLKAACFQHELDHLNGVLFVDHLSNLKKGRILKKLIKEQRKKG
ncbi:peptide deformylase [Acetobacteraceae bacterium]|nr:peptide deformylase [Acetobacteraceae bacterium]